MDMVLRSGKIEGEPNRRSFPSARDPLDNSKQPSRLSKVSVFEPVAVDRSRLQTKERLRKTGNLRSQRMRPVAD